MSGLAEVVLGRLDKVRASGEGRWMARCPAHEDGRPSLMVSERDGRVGLHCFAGCDTASILDALGLAWRDLFAESLSESARSEYARRARGQRARLADLTVKVADGARYAARTLAEGEAAEVRAARLARAVAGITDAADRSLLPVGGLLLWRRREAGQHPARVWVLAGGDWSRPPREGVLLAVRDETPPAALDWRGVAGLEVHVVPRGYARLRELLVDVAAYAAPVVVHDDGQHGVLTLLGADDWSDTARDDYVHRERRAVALDLADRERRLGASGGGAEHRRFARELEQAAGV